MSAGELQAIFLGISAVATLAVVWLIVKQAQP